MAHHSDTTLSEPPLSPFSTRSLLSDGTQTSDEPADLGAFTSVFRVLTRLQHQQQATDLPAPPRPAVSNYESESDAADSSTVWSQRPIASYLTRGGSTDSRSPSNSPGVLSEDDDDDDDDDDEDDDGASGSSGTEGQRADGASPSLGYLDSALGFLASEKAKLAAAHLDVRGAPGESWRHVVEPKRRRRRKRKGGASVLARMLEQEEARAAGAAATAVPTPAGSSSSSPDIAFAPDTEARRAAPARDDAAAPAKAGARPRHRAPPRAQAQHHLYLPSSAAPPPPPPHSFPPPPDARVVRLRALAARLRHDFPQNSARLAHVLAHDDPRGPDPQPGDALTHIFIDHSNILIGFLNHAKRARRTAAPPGKPLMSFAALALILERGRPITRRVLATSSPLYQNVDAAEALGYSVHVYARVPDLSGGDAPAPGGTVSASTTTTTNNNNSIAARSAKAAAAAAARRPPPVRPATESDPGQLPSPSTARPPGTARAPTHTHARSLSATTAPPAPAPAAGPANGAAPRVRYREQGVDELLQLKLHQALVSPGAEPRAPAGATIVLATGDGAGGQFNEDGFVGVVRTALGKGWAVELYAWGGGLSGAWRRVAEEEGRGRLRIWEMDPYVNDLLEVGGAP